MNYSFNNYKIINKESLYLIDTNKIINFFYNNFFFISKYKIENTLSKIKNNSKSIDINLLLYKQEIVGGIFWFKLDGCKKELWSPSHLVVLNKHRSYSLVFINSVFKNYRNKILNITPSKTIEKILSAMKFKRYTFGSLLVPISLFNFSNKDFDGIFKRLTESPIYTNEIIDRNIVNDQFWLVYNRNGKEYFVGLKKSERFKIPFLILIYLPIEIFDTKFIKDLIIYSKKLCWTFILFPNFGINLKIFCLHLDKMSIWTDSEMNSTYTLVSSEITEFF